MLKAVRQRMKPAFYLLYALPSLKLAQDGIVIHVKRESHQERPKHLMRWSKSEVLRLTAVYLSNLDNTSQECIIVTTTAFFLWVRA